MPASSGFVEHPFPIQMAVQMRVIAPNEVNKSIVNRSLPQRIESKGKDFIIDVTSQVKKR